MDSSSCHRYCYLNTRKRLPTKPERNSQIKLVLFDMDGVLVDSISSWRHVHTHFSTNNDHAVKAYVQGKITDNEFIRHDVNQWKQDGQHIFKKELQSIFSTITLMNGAQTCIQQLQKYDVQIGIVSAGIDVLANKVATILNIPLVYANELETDLNGQLTGEGKVHVPLMQKDAVVEQIAYQLHLHQGEIAAVGNSCFDIPLLRSVGFGIAFQPDDDCIISEADEVIYKKDLTEVFNHLQPFLSKKMK
ncbi:MAG: HAD-IB family phosphatase [Candidatus Thermoplasmatota archaeon]|nr:HAD-IB family phosphatase [Candidatus Thermoplasmatota archaeon]